MKVNDILVCKWGCGQINVDFFQVLRCSDKTITMRMLEKHYEPGECTLSNLVTPKFNEFEKDSKPERRKLYTVSGVLVVKAYDWALARLWDGEPCMETFWN